MNWKRFLAYLLGAVALVLGGLAYGGYVYQLGFPDGFITELGLAERKLAFVFIVISVVLGGCGIYLGVVAGERNVGGKLTAAAGFYLLVLIGTALVDFYFHSHLMGSGGG